MAREGKGKGSCDLGSIHSCCICSSWYVMVLVGSTSGIRVYKEVPGEGEVHGAFDAGAGRHASNARSHICSKGH